VQAARVRLRQVCKPAAHRFGALSWICVGMMQENLAVRTPPPANAFMARALIPSSFLCVFSLMHAPACSCHPLLAQDTVLVSVFKLVLATCAAVLDLAPGIACLTGLTSFLLAQSGAMPAALISALACAGGHLAELKLHAPFGQEDAEVFAVDALPRMRGLQRLVIQFAAAAGHAGSCAVARAAGRLPMLRVLSCSFSPSTMARDEGWDGTRSSFSEARKAGAPFQGNVSCNTLVAVAMLPCLAGAPALEKLSLSLVSLSVEQQVAVVPHVRAMPRLQELAGVLDVEKSWEQLPHLVLLRR
jgi:hypothetical protein